MTEREMLEAELEKAYREVLKLRADVAGAEERFQQVMDALGIGETWKLSGVGPVNLAQAIRAAFGGLRAAVAEHHAQKADDRCWMDDDKLYAAAGLPPVDRRVGSKEEMLRNCQRFIERRCEGGGWPTYAEVEAERSALRAEVARLQAQIEGRNNA